MNFWDTLKAGAQDLFPKVQMRSQKKKSSGGRFSFNSEWVAFGLLVLLGVVYFASVISMMSRAYVDLGDGNYLYTSKRVTEGLVLYRDFLAPQPPMHLVVGAWLMRIGGLFGTDGPLFATRVFTMLAHFLTACWLYLLGRRLTQTPYGGFIAALIFLLLPIGYWWTMGYQSETQEIFWLVGSLWFFLNFRPVSMVVSGLMMGFAVLTNMTAAPYAVASVFYLLVRFGIDRRGREGGGWKVLAAYVVSMCALLTVVIGYYQIRTGAYFENVIFNQVGSYPTDGFWAYAFGKVASQTSNIFKHEGGYVVLGVLGLLLYNRTDARPEREYLVWYGLALFLSFLYVTKGGTMDYIFVIAEPAVALFGAVFLVNFFYPSTFRRFKGKRLLKDTTVVGHIGVILLLMFIVMFQPLLFMYRVREGFQFEQGADDVAIIEMMIRDNSQPGDRIVAQPYYAFVSDRLLEGEVSEWFLWNMRYSNDVESMFVTDDEGHEFGGIIRKFGALSDPVSRYLYKNIPAYYKRNPDEWKQTPDDFQSALLSLSSQSSSDIGSEVRKDFIRLLNQAVVDPGFASEERLAGLDVTQRVMDLVRGNAIGADRVRLNRLVLESVYGESMAKNVVAHGEDPAGIAKIKAVARSLERREIPVVVCSVSNPLIRASQEINFAIARNYDPVLKGETFKRMGMKNFHMQVFVPKGQASKQTRSAGAVDGFGNMMSQP